ncbi:VOC family protein [Prescottella subtropica]|uniref:VOC family protein n=1 Tax=Prescottella subtropica TaxID=2545757 RepID=UPI001387332F|nr:VOC family protein [Prescottella subtropica]
MGLYVKDLAVQKRFYEDVLNLQSIDESAAPLRFMNADLAGEHHEIVLWEDPALATGGVQQISFRCYSLQDVTDYVRVFREEGVQIERVVTHGVSLSVYFFDPEGNRLEVYAPTGDEAKQPFAWPIDIDADPDEVMRQHADALAKYGKTGTLGHSPAKED